MAAGQAAVSTGVRCLTRTPGFAHGCGPGAGLWHAPAMEAAAPALRGRSSPARAPGLHQGASGAQCPPAAVALPVEEQRGPGSFGEECWGPMPNHPIQSRTEEQTHTGVEAANAGTNSIVASSRDTGGSQCFPESTPSPSQPRLGSATPAQVGVSTRTPLQLGSQLPYPIQTSSEPHLALPPSFRASFPRGLSSSSCTR